MKMFRVIAWIALLICSQAYEVVGKDTTTKGDSRIVDFVELRAAAGTVEKLIYLEALSLMGDVGEGGGSVRKWQQEFQLQYQRRLKNKGSTTVVETNEGRCFAFSRKRLPVEEFSRFELKTIIEFRTRSHGVISMNNVYNYQLRDLDTSVPVNRPNINSDIMADLISFETLEGVIIPLDEITDVTVEFKLRP